MRANPNLGIMRAFTRKTFEAIARGNHLSNVELSHLLQRIAADPLDRISRLAVLGAHVVSPRVRGDQILWFIDNEPFTSLGMYAVNLDGEAQYRRAAELWQRAVQRWDNDLRVLENAAWFFASVEPPRAVELVESGVECSPHDADAWELAAIVFDFVAAVDSKNAKGWWERSIESAFRSFAEDPEPERRMELLLSMREAVSRVERHEVLELLDLASAAFLGAQDLSIAPRSQSLLSAVGFIALADGKPPVSA